MMKETRDWWNRNFWYSEIRLIWVITKTVCEKVFHQVLTRFPCALLSFKELINRVLVYCVLPGVSNPVQVLVICSYNILYNCVKSCKVSGILAWGGCCVQGGWVGFVGFKVVDQEWSRALKNPNPSVWCKAGVTVVVSIDFFFENPNKILFWWLNVL